MIWYGAMARAHALARGCDNWMDAHSYNEDTGVIAFWDGTYVKVDN